jgi:hypothetical protein
MDSGAIREAMHQQPFRPFSLRLADGRTIDIPHPDFIAIAGNGRRFVVFNATNDAMSILEPLLVVSIEYAATEPGTGPQTGTGA